MKYSIGLDIGGTKCAVCVGLCGPDAVEIKAREEFPTAGKTWQDVLGIYAERIGELRKTYEIANIGISCGGPLDSKAGLILSPPNLPGWDGVPIVKSSPTASACPCTCRTTQTPARSRRPSTARGAARGTSCS